MKFCLCQFLYLLLNFKHSMFLNTHPVYFNVDTSESIKQDMYLTTLFLLCLQRTGAKIYHMTENISESGRNVVRSLSRNRSREPSSEPSCSRESDSISTRDPNTSYDQISATENVDPNESFEGTIERKKKRSGFKEWDKVCNGIYSKIL